MDKEKKIKNTIGIIIGIFLILVIYATYQIIKTNLIPFKYIVWGIIGLIIIVIGLIFLIKFVKKKWLQVLGTLFFIAITSVILAGTYYIGVFDKFVNDTVRNNDSVDVEYYLIAKKTASDYLEKYYDTNIGIMETDAAGCKKYLETINLTSYNSVEKDIFTLIENLNDSLVSAIVLNTGALEMLEEAGINLNDSFKILDSQIIQIKNEVIAKKVNVKSDSFIVYISGIDTDGEIIRVSRSDVNILMVISPSKKSILLVHIPRDTYMPLAGINTNLKDKLTHTGIYGINMSVKSLEKFFNIDINYYVRLNFSSFVKTVDVVGGVDVYNEYTFTSKGKTFNKGNIHLDGNSALLYSRERKSLREGDVGRGEHQMDVIKAFVNKASDKTLLLKFADILEVLSNSFETNLTKNEISNFVNAQLNKSSKWKVESYSLRGVGALEYVYSMKSTKTYVMNLHSNDIATAKSKIFAYSK